MLKLYLYRSTFLSVCFATTVTLLLLGNVTGIVVAQEPKALQPAQATEEADSTAPTASTVIQLSGARVIKDLVYASVGETSLLCDVYLPDPSTENSASGQSDTAELAPKESELRPAVILIHGGGWAIGDKWSVSNYARSFAATGIVAISINYRHAPKYKFPAQVDDVRAALVWVEENAEEYCIDTSRIGMFGYSAGGHLSCMIGTLVDAPWETVRRTTKWTEDDPRWDKLPKVCSVVGGGAPCDFRDLPIDNTAIAYFLGGSRRDLPETYKAASPAEHASSGDAPTLFIHGSQDMIVPIASSRILFEAQQRAGVPSRFLALDGPGHMLTFISKETQTAALEFLTQTLLPKSQKPANAPAASSNPE